MKGASTSQTGPSGVITDGRMNLTLSLDEYVVGPRVGSGTSGVVYRAQHRASGQPVALKILHQRPLSELRQHLSDAEQLRNLSHPYIVRTLQTGELDDGRGYIAMEWLDGEDLSQRLQRDRPSAVLSLKLAACVAEGISAAHRANIIHRDIKPANIFLCEATSDGWVPKVVDFGTAMRIEFSGHSENTIVGTPAYMAPEQVRGDNLVGPHSDIYSLGATLYELLTGQPPHAAPSYLATLARLATTPPRRLSELKPDIHPELDRFVHQMLALNPADRPRDMQEVASALDELAVLISRASPSEREPRSMRLGSSTSRLVTTIVASGFENSEARDEALRELCAHEAEAVPLGRRSLVAHLGARRSRGNEATSALALGRLLAQRGARVGVATGRALIPYVDADEPIHPIGEAVDRATQFSRAAEGGQVLADNVTAEFGFGRYHLTRHPRGQSFVVGGRSGTSRSGVGATTPFVGRDRELERVLRAFDADMDQRRATVVSISGAPGLGKSRLQREAVSRLVLERRVHDPVHQRNDPYGQRRALGAALDAVRSLLKLAKGMPTGLVRQTILRRAGDQLDERLRSKVPLLAEVLSIQQPPQASDHPSKLRDLLWLMMTRIFESRLMREPVVLVMEDVQWADPESLGWLEHLMLRAAAAPLFVIVTARHEFWTNRADAFAQHHHVRIDLHPISHEATREIAASLAGHLPQSSLDRIVSQAAGSPLFVEELARLAAAGTNVAMAPTLEAAIQVSLDTLTVHQADALGRLSVLGPTVWDDALIHLGMADAELLLDELTEQEILVMHEPSRFEGQCERHFKHSIVCDVAYSRLGDEQRRALHALAARWLERVVEDPAVVARHLDLAQLPEEAAQFWAVAAQRALSANALNDALRMAERALMFATDRKQAFERARLLDEAWARFDARASDRESAISAMEENVHDDASAVCALGARARYDSARGQGLDVNERLAQARDAAQRLQLYDEQAASSAELAARLAFAGDFAAAQQEADRLLQLERHEACLGAAVDGWQTLAIVHQGVGALSDALIARRNAAHAARDAELRERESVLTTNLGFALTTVGAKDEARQMLMQGLELARAIGSTGAQRHALMLLLCWASVFGTDPALDELLFELRSGADEAAEGMWTAPARENLGVLYYRGVELISPPYRRTLGQGGCEVQTSHSPPSHRSAERGRILLRIAAQAYRNTANRDVLPVALGMWGRGEFACGNTATALQLAREALSLLDSGAPSLLNETPIFLVLHDACLEAGQPPAARAAIERALLPLARRARGLKNTPYLSSFVRQLDDNARLLQLAQEYQLLGPEDRTLFGLEPRNR